MWASKGQGKMREMEWGSSLGPSKSPRLQEIGFIFSQAVWLSKDQLVLDAHSPQQSMEGMEISQSMRSVTAGT